MAQAKYSQHRHSRKANANCTEEASSKITDMSLPLCVCLQDDSVALSRLRLSRDSDCHVPAGSLH